MERIVLNDREYIIYSCESCEKKPEKIIFVMVDKSDEAMAEEIIYADDISESKLMLVFCLIDNWNRDLSPWKAPAVFGKEDFGGEGKCTLGNITDVCIPYLIESYNIDTAESRFFICGYSLAGLFALWAVYNTDVFKGAVSCSGSLWFKGFEEYIKGRKLPEDCSIYLSLGDREHKTKNPVMSRVKLVTEYAYKLYGNTPEVKNLKLEWNEGNHFNNPDERLKKGILWVIENVP